MSFGSHFKYLFRKSPFFRIGTYFFIILTGIAVFLIITQYDTPQPFVENMSPVVGEPGDTLTLTGKYFGNKETSSYVEIGGNRITSSLYISWKDDRIQLILPSNIEDGLVYVCTKTGKSEPRMFANKAVIPVPVEQNTIITIPVINGLNVSTASVGDLITIYGNNFEELRDDSLVLFPTNEKNSNLQPVMIACSARNKDYQYWSANELQVRVPEGAVSGELVVQTAKGTSDGYALKVSANAGYKKYTNKLTYVLSVNADVADVVSDKSALITLFVPKPVVDGRQRSLIIEKSDPEPAMLDFMDTIVQQFELNSVDEKQSVLESYVLSVWGVQTTISEWNINDYSTLTKTLYREYLQPNAIVPSGNPDVIQLAQSIVTTEKNPYIKARLIYDYMVNNYEVMSSIRASDADVVDLIESKTGDAYDFAVLYTALLRAVEIPAVTDAGILVDSSLTTKNHWWCEFYIEDVGWVSVDPAMGAGYVFGTFKSSENVAEDHFGQIDSRHIAFSHGWKDIKPAYSNSKKVYRAKTWALMSIWEESSATTEEYSSFWNDVIVTGVY